MFIKYLISFLIWVSTIFVSFSHTPFSTTTFPQGTNPLNVEESKVVAYLKDNPTLSDKTNFVFVDSDEDYKLAHLMGKYVVDVRFRTKPVISESTSIEEVQDKINKIKSVTSIESDEVVLALLGNMTETVKVSD